LGERRYSSYSFLTSALDGGVVSVTPRPRFTPGERTPGTHYTGGWVGPRAGLDTEAGGAPTNTTASSRDSRFFGTIPFWPKRLHFNLSLTLPEPTSHTKLWTPSQGLVHSTSAFTVIYYVPLVR
jgi:hypothetical protein